MDNNLIKPDDDYPEIKLCPEEICERASILYFNGFGFPGPNDLINDKFTLAELDYKVNIDLSILRMATGSTHLEIEIYGGHTFVTIYWHEYSLYKNILNILLILGIKFTTTNKLNINFDPINDKEYNRQIEETKFIEKYYKLIDELNLEYFEGFQIVCNNDPAFLNEWNWTTNEGKEFSKDLRHSLNLPPINQNSQDNFFKSKLFKNCNLETLESIENDDKIKKIKKSDKNHKCLICFERNPETIVVPCGHCVVCYICSEKLKDSNHRDKCIMCRGHIEKIIDIKQDQVKKIFYA